MTDLTVLGGTVLSVLMVDFDSRQVILDGEALKLTPTEFNLLAMLATAPDRAVSKRVLTKDVFGYHDDSNSRTVDSHVCRLRRKMRAASGCAWVVNLWGYGYKLRSDRSMRVTLIDAPESAITEPNDDEITAGVRVIRRFFPSGHFGVAPGEARDLSRQILIGAREAS